MKHVLTTALRSWLNKRGIEMRRNATVDPLRLIGQVIDRSDPIIFDVGAHIGLTCLEYRRHFPAAHIHAFEPFPASFSRLQQAVAGDDRTHIYPLALSDVAGESLLRVNRSEATNSLLPVAADAGRAWGEGLLEAQGSVAIATQSLDGFCLDHGIERVDLLKLDVQGAEYAVLQGSSRLLSAQAIALVYTEIITASTYDGQHPLHEYLTLMAEHGYGLVDFYNPIRRQGRLLQADLIFANEATLAHPSLRAN